MRLFQRAHRTEGERFGDDTFLTVGSTIANGYAVGSYIRIEIPFKRDVDYIDPITFVFMRGPCRPTYLRTKRFNAPWSVKPVVKWHFAWVPVDLDRHRPLETEFQ